MVRACCTVTPNPNPNPKPYVITLGGESGSGSGSLVSRAPNWGITLVNFSTSAFIVYTGTLHQLLEAGELDIYNLSKPRTLLESVRSSYQNINKQTASRDGCKVFR